jgi:citrate lyase subunit beta/citryl-CoA lyase
MHRAFTVGPALLFCPADRPERYTKAAERADAPILDLEDAVADDQKPSARRALVENPLDPESTIVRINSGAGGARELDLAAVRAAGYHFVMVSKCEGVEDLDGLDDFDVIAQVETPRGYLNVHTLAELPNVVALFWGAEDLAVGLGGTSSRDAEGKYTLPLSMVRTGLLLAAAAAGKVAIDAVSSDFGDLEGLKRDAEDAARWGFAATACIHPSQVEVIRAAYVPDEATIEHARRVVAAAGEGGGAFNLDGAMIDAPLVNQAARIVSRAATSKRV